jgi:hypothetical protein
MPEKAKCKTCTHYTAYRNPQGIDENHGECRLLPRQWAGGVWSYTHMQEFDTCGQHQEKESE